MEIFQIKKKSHLYVDFYTGDIIFIERAFLAEFCPPCMKYCANDGITHVLLKFD